MFWTDFGSAFPGIYKANMDGSDRKEIVRTDTVWPNGLAIDHAGTALCVQQCAFECTTNALCDNFIMEIRISKR